PSCRVPRVRAIGSKLARCTPVLPVSAYPEAVHDVHVAQCVLHTQGRGSIMNMNRREFLQLLGGAGGGSALGALVASGVSLAPTAARAQALRIKDAKTTPSVCPFCSVGCATLVHTVEGKIVNIEGDPRSPHNEGTLCPKGAATFQLHVNPNRPTQVLHRAPGAADWEVWDLERAMQRVTEL